jgi:hypothetical protein
MKEPCVSRVSHRYMMSWLRGFRLHERSTGRTPARRVCGFCELGLGTLLEVLASAPRNVLRDEKGKRRPRQWASLPFIIGSGFSESSVPQNLGKGQKECHDRKILGMWSRPRKWQK